jgi:F-type H+-transporting ATPase subunit alpha
VLLWRGSDNLVAALLLAGAARVEPGDGAECRVRGILQVVDDKEGPTTKREYHQAMSPGEY